MVTTNYNVPVTVFDVKALSNLIIFTMRFCMVPVQVFKKCNLRVLVLVPAPDFTDLKKVIIVYQRTSAFLIASKLSTGNGGKHKIIIVKPNFCLFKNMGSGFGLGYLKVLKFGLG